MRTYLFTLLLLSGLLAKQTVLGKSTELPAILTDSAPNEASLQKCSFTSYIVPTAMVAYGIASLKVGFLKNWNESIQNRVWIRNPHQELHLDNYLQYTPAVAVYALHLMGVKSKHNVGGQTVILATSGLIASLATFGGKRISREWRPDSSDRHSFPSGHSSTAFATAELLRQEYKDVSPWYSIGGFVAATATAYLRVYNNKHWFGDVVAGAGVGILSTDLAYYLYPSISRLFTRHKYSDQSTLILPTYQQGAAGFALVHSF